MSYYFTIVGSRDNPLFECEFGTSKQGKSRLCRYVHRRRARTHVGQACANRSAGGDGVARFPGEARRLNPFVVHAALDIVEDVQWVNSQMYVSLRK